MIKKAKLTYMFFCESFIRHNRKMRSCILFISRVCNFLKKPIFDAIEYIFYFISRQYVNRC